MRDRFDQNRNITDPNLAVKLVEEGERELFETQHFQPKKCKFTCFIILIVKYT